MTAAPHHRTAIAILTKAKALNRREAAFLGIMAFQTRPADPGQIQWLDGLTRRHLPEGMSK